MAFSETVQEISQQIEAGTLSIYTDGDIENVIFDDISASVDEQYAFIKCWDLNKNNVCNVGDINLMDGSVVASKAFIGALDMRNLSGASGNYTITIAGLSTGFTGATYSIDAGNIRVATTPDGATTWYPLGTLTLDSDCTTDTAQCTWSDITGTNDVGSPISMVQGADSSDWTNFTEVLGTTTPTTFLNNGTSLNNPKYGVVGTHLIYAVQIDGGQQPDTYTNTFTITVS